MKIDCNRSLLASALAVVGSVIPSKTPPPILQNVLLEVKKGKAVLIGTDSEISIRHDVSDVTCTGSDSVLLPVKKVRDVLAELRSERVTLDCESKILRVSCDRGKFNIPTSNTADFPVIKEFKEQSYYTMPGDVVRRMIRRTIFATDPSSSRFALGGVLFDVSGKKLTTVATDGGRMSICCNPCEAAGDESGFTHGAVIPNKALSLVERTIPDTADVVHFSFTSSEAMFKTEFATITTRLVEGRFPRYQDVIPRSHAVSLDLMAGALHSLIRQSMILTNKESRGVDFEFSKGTLKLLSQGADVGNSEVELPISFDLEPVVIRLDPLYFSEFLKTVPAEFQIGLKLTDDEHPIVLTTDDGSTYAIMSMQRAV